MSFRKQEASDVGRNAIAAAVKIVWIRIALIHYLSYQFHAELGRQKEIMHISLLTERGLIEGDDIKTVVKRPKLSRKEATQTSMIVPAVPQKLI